MYAMALLQVRSDTVFDQTNNGPLYDPLANETGEWNFKRSIPDHLMLFGILSTILLLAADINREVALLKILKRILIITGFLYLLRAITISVTTMPPPFTNCKLRKANNVKNYVVNALEQIIGNLSCTDLIFSGHALSLIIACLTIDYYFSHRYMVPMYYLLAIGGSLTIIAARMHYTVDVILSWIIVVAIFVIYHLIIMIDLSPTREDQAFFGPESKYPRPIWNWFIRGIKFLDE